ncbi:hypothetical protein Acsp04_60550 [Actinomadura sp. NBRC 104425]|uniref:hypothetical protein n=1 Tax=Actinomadura sp. NBRC 104425 TaxID=3032204 RepID=UPI00249FFBB6|nr:hypothetical protein [Actinomadura sp. NBRC 104425]GLZ15820.1 hypothetical protein Acsp04_60550 [Actinomadura sp. NBRC 104425]
MGSLDRPREADGKQVIAPEATRLLERLASLLHAHELTAENKADRLQVSAGRDSRAVEVACLRRPDDGDRWWFSWGGGIWLCEADNPTEAMVQIKGALRRVGS